MAHEPKLPIATALNRGTVGGVRPPDVPENRGMTAWAGWTVAKRETWRRMAAR
jgi:hypothetical protein